ncbi:MAG: peptidoglycan DD-metalloendopeptidase family protein [Actinomycetia bacterium]|nr:peptidoglycan DD-metalloendopeptidase family protein [Actinomycetes bacterium]MCP5034218.1 peptidoglycan DD-metalloendopeptidase family protein [Actinomycetes bacterium]
MDLSSVGVALVAVSLMLFVGVSPVAATEEGSTTTPLSTVPTSDPGQEPSEPEPTAPEVIPDPTTPENTPATTDPASGESTTVVTGPDGEVIDTSLDPLVDEPPGEEAPPTDQTDLTVPAPSGSYGDQGEFEPAQVLWSSVQAADRRLADAQTEHVAAIEIVRAARLRRKELLASRAALNDEDRQALGDLERAEVTLQQRAVAAFVSNDAAVSAIVGSFRLTDHDDLIDLRARRVLLDVALEQDEKAIAEVVRLRDRLDRSIVAVLDALRAVEVEVASGEELVSEAAEVVAQAGDEAEAFRAGSSIYISGVVFPVSQPDIPLIDSFGFPRMPGTPDEHWHEGIDIFAPAGSPLIAAERGVITRISTGRLGGLSLWLRGQSGADWYYAHLQSYAPGLVEGQLVEAGDLVGYVGNTGNALTTPAHLHLELHPEGDDPINPYPLLNVIVEGRPEIEPGAE